MRSVTPPRIHIGTVRRGESWSDLARRSTGNASDAEAVAREVREELGVEVEVGVVIDDVPADPPDGTYTRWRTFVCRLKGGEPTACGADGGAELTAVRWLPLGDGEAWDAELRSDPFLYPQLERIRAAHGLRGASE